MQNRYDALSKAHEAYKKHTNTILDSERILNNHLAVYSSNAQPPPTQRMMLPEINMSNHSLLSNGQPTVLLERK